MITLSITLLVLFGSILWLDIRNHYSGVDFLLVLILVMSMIYIIVSFGIMMALNNRASGKTNKKHLTFFINENIDFFDEINQALVIQKFVRDASGAIKDIKILNANYIYETLMELNINQVKNKTLTQVFNVKTPPFYDYYKALDHTKKTQTFTSYFPLHKKYYHITMTSLGEDKLAVVFLDVSSDHTLSSELSSMSYKDSLTGLYNWRYYKEIIQKYSQTSYLPLSIIIVDLNALKIFNDAFGHEFGNELIMEAADFLNKTFGFWGKVMRTGGDEFVVLLPNMNFEIALNKLIQAKQKSANVKVGNFGVSMSFGLTTMKDKDKPYDYHLRVAENKMYHYKIKDGIRLRTELLKQVQVILFKNVPFEKDHANRVIELCETFAQDLELAKNLVGLLKDSAQYHDIGKVTIDKKLLNSSKTLNDAEITMIQSHVEVGYRLLSSTPDKGAIADIVLSHHENVDGSGYPRKIEKASIPLLSRMLRIVETYDILTNKTPYSNAMSKDKAAREMLRYAGTWYDKTLLESFLSKTIKVRI